MKYKGPGVKFMDFEDSTQETVYYVVSAFEGKTYEDGNKDYRVSERRDFMRTIIYDAFRYGDGLLDDRIFRNNYKLVDKLAEELYIILKQSLKECSGAFCENPRHCADEYLKKHCKVLFKRIMAESDFTEGV
jgi:hypothetical protein